MLNVLYLELNQSPGVAVLTAESSFSNMKYDFKIFIRNSVLWTAHLECHHCL